ILGGQKPGCGNFAGPHQEVPACSGGCLMGLDFIRNAAPGFNRVLDRRLVEMHSAPLFSRDRRRAAARAAGAKAPLCQWRGVAWAAPTLIPAGAAATAEMPIPVSMIAVECRK